MNFHLSKNPERNVSVSTYFIMISDGWYDIKDWSNNAENSALPSDILNILWNRKQFTMLLFLLYFWSYTVVAEMISTLVFSPAKNVFKSALCFAVVGQ